MKDVKTQIEKLDGNIVKIEVTVDSKAAKDAYDKILKRMSSNMNLAGFRKGKVPALVAEKHIGEDAIKQETLNYLCNDIVPDIVAENNYDLAIQPNVETYEYTKGQEFKFTLKIELKPEFDMPAYKGKKYKFEEFKNDENIVENELKMVQERFATFEKVEGRASKEDDVVVFDFEGFLDGVAFEHGKGENYELDLAHSNFIPGFAEALVGHSAGEEFTIDVKFPEDYHAENLKGKDTQFKINLHEIKERKLPELTDELAAKAGPFKTVNDLKESIEKYLADVKTREDARLKTEAALDGILAELKVDIQETMVKREEEAVRNEYFGRARGRDIGEFIKAEGGAEEFNKKVNEEAVRRIKNSLIIEKITQLENITIEQNDIIQEMTEIAQIYGENSHFIFDEIKRNPNSLQILTKQAATKKVCNFIVENNEFISK